MGGFTNAISNALAARGNALSQGELQRGQVWGNLAANLGQIPGQAIAFHQQREAAMQNNELKKITIEKAQRTADREKRAIQIVNSGKPKDQIYAELKMLASEDPEDFLRFQNTESELAMKQKHLDLDIAQKDFTQRSGLPGTEFERPIVPQPQNNALGVGGPPIPVPQRQMEFERMVHPKNALGVRPPTDVDIRERTAATDALAMGKFAQQQDILETDREKLATVKAGLLKDKPVNLSDVGDYVEDQAAAYKEKTGKEATHEQRVAWREKYKLMGAEYRTAHPSTSTGFPVYRQYSSPDGNESRMINVKDDAERTGIEAQGWFPGAPAKMSAGQQNDLRDTESVQQVLNSIKAGYKKNYVGKMDRIGGAIGSFTGLNSRERQDFLQQVQTAFNVVGKLRSGANWTLPEIERLKQELPTEGMSDVQFESALANSLGIIERKLASINEVAARTGTRLAPKGGSPAAPVAGVGPYKDPGKEARYQEWLLKNKGK